MAGAQNRPGRSTMAAPAELLGSPHRPEVWSRVGGHSEPMRYACQNYTRTPVGSEDNSCVLQLVFRGL